MVAVLLLPVVLILAACLLERLERRVVAVPAPARTPMGRPDAQPGAIAEVVPLHGGARRGPAIDGETLRLRRAA